MKIVSFPRRGDAQDDALVAELDAALSGESGGGPEAESWRELRCDVRALAPPLSPEVERELWRRVAERSVPRAARTPVRPRPRVILTSLATWLASGLRARLLAGSGVVVIAAIVTVAIVAPWQESRSRLPAARLLSSSEVASGASSSAESRIAPLSSEAHRAKGRSYEEESKSLSPVVSTGGADESSSATSSHGTAASVVAPEATRVQQRGASLTLAPRPEAVQAVADEVAQLAARDGGFVQSSHVSLQHGASGEANLQLSLPSARLSTALAEIARLAPARAESQSLQDITDEYDADRVKLSDAVAERQALLRALAKTSTQGEIESLHARLALAAAAITRARNEYEAVSKRGNNSSVEVSVLGDAHARSSESTLSTALRDAGDVLKAALAVAIVALALLVPLAILLVLLALGLRATRRRLRERALS
jgi:hypothetical protein